MVYFWLINLVLILVSPSSYAQLMLQKSLALTPSPGDLSIVFLSQLFGSVDGVLGGTGSQIFGQMMSIFNGAILALGSIFVFYTVVVGTLSTAHEGEFLGRQWSSIWLPVRSVLGISILSPGLSGYSLIQVFVMWVVVQGVGAADKIWNSAMDYLNAGGTIYKTQQAFASSQKDAEVAKTGNPTYKGAATILTGQVCMLTVQRLLEQLRQNVIKASNSPCNQSPVPEQWKTICFTPVPDFMNTFDSVNAEQQANENNNTISLKMPNFSAGKQSEPFYNNFEGLCGTVVWNRLSNSNPSLKTGQTTLTNNGINSSQFQTILNSRAIAIQTMFNFLQTTARAMVSNSPIITNENYNDNNCAVTISGKNPPNCFAKQQYGYSFTSANQICKMRSDDCTIWASLIDPQARSSMTSLLAGPEFANALNAYDGVMSPILTLEQQLADSATFSTLRTFIWEAKVKGWILAGTYFYDLIRLSDNAKSKGNLKDSQSGLGASVLYSTNSTAFPRSCDRSSQGICQIVNFLGPAFDKDRLGLLDLIISGEASAFPSLNICSSTAFSFGEFDASTGYVTPNARLSPSNNCSTNVLGYIGNAFFLNLPGDPKQQLGINPPVINNTYTPPPMADIPPPNFACGGRWYILFGACIGRAVMQAIFWPINFVLRALQWVVMQAAGPIWYSLVTIPLQHYMFPIIMDILKQFSTNAIDKDLNPIVVLGSTGRYIIQTTLNAYWSMATFMFLGGIPLIGGLVSIIASFMLPLFFAWLSLFVFFGFTTAYYVPLLPYIIFLFGAIGWLMAVIEAMVAAPILALGIMSPEGEGLSGKSERGFLILVNVFLRPSMMIVGYVVAIALSYVSVHILIYGFTRGATILNVDGSVTGVEWYGYMLTRAFAKCFSIFIFVSVYATLVQKCFTLIFMLPDRVMRWIGGGPESYGSDTEKWLDELKNSVEDFAKSTDKGMAGGVTKMLKFGNDSSGKGGDEKNDAGKASGSGA